MLDAGSRPRKPFTNALGELSGNGSLGALGTYAPLLSYYQSPCQASAPETSPSLRAKWKWLLFVHTHSPAHLPITQGRHWTRRGWWQYPTHLATVTSSVLRPGAHWTFMSPPRFLNQWGKPPFSLWSRQS